MTKNASFGTTVLVHKVFCQTSKIWQINREELSFTDAVHVFHKMSHSIFRKNSQPCDHVCSRSVVFQCCAWRFKLYMCCCAYGVQYFIAKSHYMCSVKNTIFAGVCQPIKRNALVWRATSQSNLSGKERMNVNHMETSWFLGFTVYIVQNVAGIWCFIYRRQHAKSADTPTTKDPVLVGVELVRHDRDVCHRVFPFISGCRKFQPAENIHTSHC